MKKPSGIELNIMLEQAWKKFEKKNFDAAQEIFSDIVEANDQYSEALHGLAGCYLRKNEPDKALEIYQKLEKINAEDSRAYHLRALAHGADDDINKAIEDLEKAIEIAGDDFEAYLDLGGAFLVKKNYQRAAQCFEKCIDLDGKCSEAWTGKALVAYFNKEQKAALEYITISLKLNPKSLLALLLKTEILVETGKKNEVQKELKKILAIDPAIFKSTDDSSSGEEDEHEEHDDYHEVDEDAFRDEDDEIEEFDLDD